MCSEAGPAVLSCRDLHDPLLPPLGAWLQVGGIPWLLGGTSSSSGKKGVWPISRITCSCTFSGTTAGMRLKVSRGGAAREGSHSPFFGSPSDLKSVFCSTLLTVPEMAGYPNYRYIRTWLHVVR